MHGVDLVLSLVLVVWLVAAVSHLVTRRRLRRVSAVAGNVRTLALIVVWPLLLVSMMLDPQWWNVPAALALGFVLRTMWATAAAVRGQPTGADPPTDVRCRRRGCCRCLGDVMDPEETNLPPKERPSHADHPCQASTPHPSRSCPGRPASPPAHDQDRFRR